MNNVKVYFVSCNVKEEKVVIKDVKPDKLLLSYHYFKNRSLEEFCNEIGYKPEILLDSGAYSAWAKGKNISPIDYMNYIVKNKDYIDKYIMLDVIGDPDVTYKYYEIMKLKGFNPVPVYHYGDNELYLRQFINDGCDFIALGNTVPIKDKNKVAEWINYLTDKFPEVKFHLLGSSSKKITQNTNLYSCDSSTWIMMAINGYPKHIEGRTHESKVARAKYNMEQIIEENNLNTYNN